MQENNGNRVIGYMLSALLLGLVCACLYVVHRVHNSGQANKAKLVQKMNISVPAPTQTEVKKEKEELLGKVLSAKQIKDSLAYQLEVVSFDGCRVFPVVYSRENYKPDQKVFFKELKINKKRNILVVSRLYEKPMPYSPCNRHTVNPPLSPVKKQKVTVLVGSQLLSDLEIYRVKVQVGGKKLWVYTANEYLRTGQTVYLQTFSDEMKIADAIKRVQNKKRAKPSRFARFSHFN